MQNAVNLLGEDRVRCRLGAGTTTDQLHRISDREFTAFDHKTVERELTVEPPVLDQRVPSLV